MLLLYDIDGTLLRAASHKHIMEQAMEEVCGVQAQVVDSLVAGMTDSGIVQEALLAAGMPATEAREKLPLCIEAMERLFAPQADNWQAEAIDGVAEHLQQMQAVGHTLALVTGNIEPVAYGKVAAAGLAGLFRVGGAFGNESTHRPDLVRLAMQRLGGTPETTWVVGDTPRDVQAALEAGVQVLAVATGSYTADDLAAAGAETVVESLLDAWVAGMPS